tara:strand:- start:1195 stop:1710 length:516 start_codon:yes stop_codon:yes gene_type:complete
MAEVLKFVNIDLVSGISGAREGQGLKMNEGYYETGDHFAFNAGSTAVGTSTSDINTDYYIAWNALPEFTGTNSTHANQDVSSTDLSLIGIDHVRVRSKGAHSGSHLDIIVVRKSDRKAVHVKIHGGVGSAAYKSAWVANATGATGTIKLLGDKDNPFWYPERARLSNLGYI